MTPFDEALAWIFRVEGGFVDHPSDPGGATNRGVSLRAVKLRDVDRDGKLDFDLDGDGDVDADDIRIVGEAEARRFYNEDYWSLKGAGSQYLLSCDSLPRRWGIAVFDTAVLQGPRTAIALTQRAVGQKEDGVLGPQTLQAVRSALEAPTLARFASHRLERMRRHPKADVFFAGWCWRVLRLHQFLYGGL